MHNSFARSSTTVYHHRVLRESDRNVLKRRRRHEARCGQRNRKLIGAGDVENHSERTIEHRIAAGWSKKATFCLREKRLCVDMLENSAMKAPFCLTSPQPERLISSALASGSATRPKKSVVAAAAAVDSESRRASWSRLIVVWCAA